jgi:hypothetical protein
MTLTELKAKAKEILALKPAENFEHVEFSTKSGGTPLDLVGIEKYIVFQDTNFKYRTQYCGDAYESNTTVECISTKVTDKNDNVIYELPNGHLFVWSYKYGNAENFDSGTFDNPVI